MTALQQRLTRMIIASGPISVADYMAQCLFDPDDGYYMNREPFGTDGDFVTAPEVSQMFGELLGVWFRSAWEAIGKPMPVTIAEIGPGRGTLMKDVGRTLQRLDPALMASAGIALIEISPRLRAIQKQMLAGMGLSIAWYDTIDAVPPGPLILFGNELFDAIPLRQFVKVDRLFRERVVGLDDAGRLRFGAGPALLDPALLPPSARDAADGAVVEVAPARVALMDTIADRLARQGGCALFVDYGYETPGIGDTFQALRRHRPEGVFDNPGHADLTAHVDFASLAAVARRAGLAPHVMRQGDFLLGLGLLERAGSLGAGAGAVKREAISIAVERLAGPDAMGSLFKVLAILPRTTVVAPFSPAH